MYYRNWNKPDRDSKCLVCEVEMIGSDGLTCSSTCQDILDLEKNKRDSQWDYDQEDALYA